MSQLVEDIKPSYPLFRQEEYKDTLSNKQELFEEKVPQEKIEEVFQWSTTVEYKELNFNREALTVNPAKACQPLGAVLCALGFERPCLTCTAHRVAWPIFALISIATSRSR